MSERRKEAENRLLARRVVEEVFNAGNLDAVPELYASGCVHGVGHPLVAAWGVEEFGYNLTLVREAFPDLRVTVEDQVAACDWVATRCTVEGSHLGGLGGCAATGRHLWVPAIFTARVRRGRISEAWYQLDTAEVAGQLGLRNGSGVAILQNSTRGL